MPRFAVIFSILLCVTALAQTAEPPPVTVQPFQDIALPHRGTAPASVHPHNDSQIAAEVTARVVQVHADVGETVRAGTLLVELDNTDYRLALAQVDAQISAAQARVALAEQRLRQTKSLKKRQFVSEDAELEFETTLQAARAELKVAQVQRAMAIHNVEKCRIHAPFAGAVVERQAQIGAMVTPSAPLMRLVDLGSPEVEAKVQANHAEELRQATDLVFENRGQRYPLRLLRLSPVVDQAARTRRARLAFTAQQALPGSSGTFRWQAKGALLPSNLLVTRGQALGIFVVESGQRQHARFITVPNAQEGRPFAIELLPETQVVIQGQQGLQDGQVVSVTDKAR